MRELRNVIERAVILSSGGVLEVRDQLAGTTTGDPEPSLRGELDAVERARITEALEASGGKVKGNGNAADRLGLSPSTLRSRMKRLGILSP